jgi:16S rRNA (cytosine1402-N4)-methyltransferase
MAYHDPVLLHESVNGLNINPAGIYVDVTFGGGGHSREILKHLTTGKLLGFDQDPDAAANVPKSENFIFVNQNFRHLKRYLRFHGYSKIDGLLADLGVSSHQFDTAHRGFTFREDAELDMRMTQSGKSAKDVLNQYDEAGLSRIFRLYGELPTARKLANLIAKQRETAPFETTGQLRQLLEKNMPQKLWHKQLAQVFQALRIEVNEELVVLESLIEQCVEVLKPGGRLVVISYHSLEDRLVKNYIRDGKFEGEAEKDFFGNKLVPFEQISRKPITPTDEELKINNRARSAKLRIAQRTTYTP